MRHIYRPHLQSSNPLSLKQDMMVPATVSDITIGAGKGNEEIKEPQAQPKKVTQHPRIHIFFTMCRVSP